MRTIKFRGKRKGIPNEWLFGDLNNVGGYVYVFYPDEDTPLNSSDWFEVIPETVGQFTGLLDKNGKEIFEGDVMKSFPLIPHGGKVLVSVIEFNERKAMWLAREIEYRETEYLFEALSPNHESEIIGNIHDNPELLK